MSTLGAATWSWFRAAVDIWSGCLVGGVLGGIVGFAAGALLDQDIGYNALVLLLGTFGVGVVVGAARGSRAAAMRQYGRAKGSMLVGAAVAIGLAGVFTRPLLPDDWQSASAFALTLWITLVPVAAHIRTRNPDSPAGPT